MSTLTLILPDRLDRFVADSAAAQDQSPENYILALIEEDRERRAPDRLPALHALLSKSARQLDNGETVTMSADEVLARGRARRQAEAE